MITTIEFKTAPAKITKDLLDAAKDHPLFLGITSSAPPDNAATYTLSFGKDGLEFASFTFTCEASGTFVLTTANGNLPALLWGHQGRVIQDQAELEAALTKLRWLGSSIVEEEDICLLLPHTSIFNCGFISGLGLAIQIADPGKKFFHAYHNATSAWGSKPASLGSGRIVWRDTQVLWDIVTLDDEVEFGEAGSPNPKLIRIECRILDPQLLMGSIKIDCPEHYYVASLPWTGSWDLFLHLLEKNLAEKFWTDFRFSNDPEFREAFQHLGSYCGGAEGLRRVMGMGQIGLPSNFFWEYPKVILAWDSIIKSVSLARRLSESSPFDLICDVFRPEVEEAHESLMNSLGCPLVADEETAETFGGLLLLLRRDPQQRIFTNLQDGDR